MYGEVPLTKPLVLSNWLPIRRGQMRGPRAPQKKSEKSSEKDLNTKQKSDIIIKLLTEESLSADETTPRCTEMCSQEVRSQDVNNLK